MFLPRYRFTFQFGFGFIFLLSAIIISIVASINSINDAQDKLDSVVNNINVKIAAVESMTEMIRNVEIYTRDIVLITDAQEMQEEMKKLLVARNIYDEAEARLDKIFVTSEDRAQLEKIKELRAKARPMVNHAIELGFLNRDQEATQLIMKEVVPITGQRIAALKQLINQQQEIGKKVAKEAGNEHAMARLLTYTLGALAFALGLFVAFIFMPAAISADTGKPIGKVVDGDL